MNGEQMSQGGQPQPPQTEEPLKPKTEGSKGALIGSIIIVVLIIGVGAYMFLNRPVVDDVSPDEILNAEDNSLDSLDSQSESDELTDIEADVNDTNLDDLDAELEDIENEINDAL